jgi:hypothetical protein
MGLRAYVVETKVLDMAFNCYYPKAWFDRLMDMGKFDSSGRMDFTEVELDELEEGGDLSDDEKEIVANLRQLMDKYGDPLELEYF